MNIEEFDKFPPGTMFAMGTASDSPTGLFMGSGFKFLRWVAIKGYADDFSLYCGAPDWSYDRIRTNGDKVQTKEYIMNVLPIDDEIYERYRH